MVERGLGALKRILPRRGNAPQLAATETTVPTEKGQAEAEGRAHQRRPSKLGYLSAQEIFRDLSPAEMDEIVVGRRLVEAEGRLEDTTVKDVSARRASLLVRLSREQGSPDQVSGLSHQDLADSLGVYRETVTSALDRRKEAGLIEVGRKRIAILRPDELSELAEG